MSYNIDSINVVHRKGFCIARTKLERLKRESGDGAPEGSTFAFLEETRRNGWFEVMEGPNDIELICPHTFWWYGEGSGSSLDELCSLLAEFEGEADLVLTWEGGDLHTGLRLRDGVVTRHKAVLGLGEEE